MSRSSHPKVVLVTGASAGIGEAVVRRFVSVGSLVVAAARRIGRLVDLARELSPDRVFPLELDVCDRTATARVIEELPMRFKGVDCLVNSAGLALGLEPAAVAWAASLPAHVNVNRIELMPVAQSFAAFAVHRE